MRRLLVAALPLLTTAGLGHAADLAQPAPVPFVETYAPYNWSGFHVGANLGGAFAKTRTAFSIGAFPLPRFDDDLSGVTGGVQAGYNWQFGPLVAGLEADFQFSDLRGSLDAPCPSIFCNLPLSARFAQEIPWFGTVRGRVGYAFDRWLVYATGGFAYARLETHASAAFGGFAASTRFSETGTGWTVGGGIEVGLAPNWSARAEYLYLDFGDLDKSWRFPTLTIRDDTTVSTHVVRAAVNYRF